MAKVLRRRARADFRVEYLQQLSYKKVWPPQTMKSPRHQTVIILDWDDTLLCTSFLHRLNGLSRSWDLRRRLSAVAAEARALLETAQRLGQAFIITNALDDWVELSAAKYMPELLPTLRSIPVISARDRYEARFPDMVAQWKMHAFMDLRKQLDRTVVTNLLSIGDGLHEYNAAHFMGQAFDYATVKTVRFRESPYPEELAHELRIVREHLEQMVQNGRGFNVTISRASDRLRGGAERAFGA